MAMSEQHKAVSSASSQPEGERRQVMVLYDYWQALRGDRPCPTEDELDPDELGALWDDCFLIQLRDIEQVEHYNYTHLGTNILDAYESGQLQAHVPGLASLEALHLADEFRKVMESGQPYFHEAEHCLNPKQVVKFRQCLLPLGDGQGNIISILGEMRFRIYEEGA